MASKQTSSNSGLPWDQGGLSISALAQTWVMVTFRPGQAFSLPLGGQWKRWFLFAVIINGAVMLGTWAIMSGRMAGGAHISGPAIGDGLSPGAALGLVLLINLVYMVFQAGLINVLLKFITRTAYGFPEALRVACYAQAPHLFSLFTPLVGPVMELFYFLWNLVIMIIGIQRTYQVSLARAIAVNVIYAVLTIYLTMVLRPA
jgi:hypothetical protein